MTYKISIKLFDFYAGVRSGILDTEWLRLGLEAHNRKHKNESGYRVFILKVLGLVVSW